jgi:hypothetical protein
LENQLIPDKKRISEQIDLLAAVFESEDENISSTLREGILLVARGEMNIYLQRLAEVWHGPDMRRSPVSVTLRPAKRKINRGVRSQW